MANIKDLKKKIKSTKGTLKITQAMKLVSAAKLSKAQIAITNSRPYANELEKTIKTVSALVQNLHHSGNYKDNPLNPPSFSDRRILLFQYLRYQYLYQPAFY